jgi:hypothetical protein
MPDEPRFSIQDLADLADVSRRTVRYYVQEGLLPAPLGVGRGRHYGRAHLDRLLQVKALQASGRTLGDIRGGGDPSQHAGASRLASAPQRSIWRRLELAPGVELHVSSETTMASPMRLRELAEWCRLHFSVSASDE